jgi:hypothetical protein
MINTDHLAQEIIIKVVSFKICISKSLNISIVDGSSGFCLSSNN